MDTNRTTPVRNKLLKGLFQLVFSLVVLGCAYGLANYYLSTSPKAKPRKRPSPPTQVQVEKIAFSKEQITLQAMGTVTGAEEIDLKPRVSGEIVSISPSFIPGSYFLKDASLLKIDPTDYELNILQLKSEAAKAQSDHDLEMGNQRIAKKEFEILGQQVTDLEKRLMLREPQLGITQANRDAIEARLKQAEIDLARTEVTAPFNAVILEKMVGTGSRITPASTLAKITGTDSFWVTITLPVHQLKWIDIPTDSPATGSVIRAFPQRGNGPHSYREGRILRLGAGLEKDGRMALLYGEIKDPLCLLPENRNKPKLLLDSFVRVEIDGRQLPDVAVVSRDHLHDNNQIWLMDKNDKLEIRTVEILAKTKDKVFIETGLQQGERIITSPLANPTEGIQLRTKGHKQKGDSTAHAKRAPTSTRKQDGSTEVSR